MLPVNLQKAPEGITLAIIQASILAKPNIKGLGSLGFSAWSCGFSVEGFGCGSGVAKIVESQWHVQVGPSDLFRITVNPIKLETGLRPNSAGITYTLLLRIEAIGFPTFGLVL